MSRTQVIWIFCFVVLLSVGGMVAERLIFLRTKHQEVSELRAHVEDELRGACRRARTVDHPPGPGQLTGGSLNRPGGGPETERDDRRDPVA